VAARERVVRLTKSFACLVPYAARTPLEAWIVPRRHGWSYEDALTAETAPELAALLSQFFAALAGGLEDPGYELVLHTAPNVRSRILLGEWATIRDDYHWHIEVVVQPEAANRVGGILVNESRPEETALRLREVIGGDPGL